MDVRLARPEDVENYAAFGREAQAWILSQGLGQSIPAAHDSYAPAIRAKIAASILYAATDGETAIGYFSLETSPSPWWPPDNMPALYIWRAWWSIDGHGAVAWVGSLSVGALRK